MKFICLGYFDEETFNAMSPAERDAQMDACMAYDEVLQSKGHVLGGEGLDSPRNAATLRHRNGKVIVTDGPFTETKEQIGGFILLEARDRDHAIELMIGHPGLRVGPWEIRAVFDMTELTAESSARRNKGQSAA